jgi:hypothetical protein
MEQAALRTQLSPIQVCSKCKQADGCAADVCFDFTHDSSARIKRHCVQRIAIGLTASPAAIALVAVELFFDNVLVLQLSRPNGLHFPLC